MDYTIWLAYVGYPVTTAVYFERALRTKYWVVSIGPALPKDFINAWNLEAMNRPLSNLDIPVPPDVDMQAVVNSVPEEYHPNLYLWVESVNIYFPKNLDALVCPKACYLIDSHINLDTHLEWAKNFDHVFIAQREYLPAFKHAGIENVHWLPLGADPFVYKKKDLGKKYDIGFVGSIQPESRREQLLDSIRTEYSLHTERCFWTDAANVFNKSKMVFNNAVKNDLNMRVFEVLSTGSMLLTDDAPNSGFDELFIDGQDLVVYEDSNINQKIGKLLKDPGTVDAVAARGHNTFLNAHTYAHRTEELMKVMRSDTATTPSAGEWRRRSQDQSNRDVYNIVLSDDKDRSFIIPVLDYSPNAPYNIETLLDDLRHIEGKVIVVFNSPEMAQQLKDHPRIDYYAALNINSGVARAWNIGMQLVETSTAFIINSDLHISRQAVETLHTALNTLPDAAVVGPEGSFFDMREAKDILRYQKSSFSVETTVDAVSGFFFALKTELVHNGTLTFENKFTPCYFEEWDFGLQVKAAGLKSWIVPTFGYEHEFSTVKRKGNLRYFNHEEPLQKITERNLKNFLLKWLQKAGLEKLEDIHPANEQAALLVTGYVVYALTESANLINAGMNSKAGNLLLKLDNVYPDLKRVKYLLGVVAHKSGHSGAAEVYFEEALQLDPTDKDTRDALQYVKGAAAAAARKEGGQGSS